VEMLKKITKESKEEIDEYFRVNQHKGHVILETENSATSETLFSVFIPKLKKSMQNQVLKDLSSILTKKCREHSDNNLTKFYENRSRLNLILRVGVSK